MRLLMPQRLDLYLFSLLAILLGIKMYCFNHSATTHTDFVIRAKEVGVKVKIIHNASIMNAIACTGLQLYSFGQTISIVFWEDNWQPDSYYDRIVQNLDHELHTLCLLDIKVKEQSVENLLRNRPIFEPPRYMTVNQAAEQLLIIAERKGDNSILSFYLITRNHKGHFSNWCCMCR